MFDATPQFKFVHERQLSRDFRKKKSKTFEFPPFFKVSIDVLEPRSSAPVPPVYPVTDILVEAAFLFGHLGSNVEKVSSFWHCARNLETASLSADAQVLYSRFGCTKACKSALVLLGLRKRTLKP